jgi:hypothetical protein
MSEYAVVYLRTYAKNMRKHGEKARVDLKRGTVRGEESLLTVYDTPRGLLVESRSLFKQFATSGLA